MYKFTEAKVLTPEEIIEQANSETSNPTLERLIFMEQRKEEGSGIWPCWVEAYGINEETKTLASLILCICQFRGGNFEILRIRVGNIDRDYGVKFRLWDQPPTDGTREANPFVDSEKAQ